MGGVIFTDVSSDVIFGDLCVEDGNGESADGADDDATSKLIGIPM